MEAAIPIPNDLPLPMPASLFVLEMAAVFLFLLHIVFVNLMVGGSILSLVYEIRGLRNKDHDELARLIAKTITVNKSMAVVLGVAPLLVLNVLYSVYFYSANALTGTAWIAVVPLVAVAFLLTYAHAYSWDRLAEQKGIHIALGATGAALFLVIPFIFLANVNLMLFPERWKDVQGFVSSLFLPNVLPRYFHFVVAAVAVTGLFLAGWFGRRGFPAEKHFTGLDRMTLRREFLSVAFLATLLQFIAGPLLYLTLPSHGVSWSMSFNILAGVALAVLALVLLWRIIREPAPALGPRYWGVIVILAGTVVFMGYGRHLYREGAIAAHRTLMAEKTRDHESAVLAAQMREATGTLRIGAAETSASPGEARFRALCMGCHARGRRLVGPPVEEIVKTYEGNPVGLIQWVRSPGKKRPDYPEMPPIRMTEAQYQEVAAYLLGP